MVETSKSLAERAPTCVSSAKLETTALTVGEVVHGLHRKRMETSLLVFRRLIHGTSVHPLDASSAWLGGQIQAELARVGRPIGRVDPFIAAIALMDGAGLATSNTRHDQYIVDLGYPLELENGREDAEATG